MTTETSSLGRTVRTIKPLATPANRFERAMWIFMRYSGLILVILALTHFGMQHVLIGSQAISAEQTVESWGINKLGITVSQLAWRAYYMAILILAMLHGMNGLRQVAYDYLQRRSVYVAFMVLAGVLITAATLMGAVALVAGASALN